MNMTLRTLLVLVMVGLGMGLGLPNLTEVTEVYDDTRVTIISDTRDQEMVMLAGEHEVGDTEADTMERVRR